MLDASMDFALLRDMPASLMVLDRELRFIAASDLYLKTVGCDLVDLIGRHVFEAFPECDDRRLPLEQSMRRALAGEGNAIERLAYAIPDPEDRSRMTQAWWRCRHNPLYGADGEVNYVIQITENITDLVRAEELKNAIAGELQHRVSNLWGLIDIIARRTAANSASLPAFLDRFNLRLQSMARTHSYLVGANWDRMSIREVVSRQLEYGNEDFADQISIAGPDITLGANEAQSLSMAVHELATNSLKYGALKDPEGKLAITWSTDAAQGFRFMWVETWSQALVPTGRLGFGSMIIDAIVPNQLGGKAVRQLAAEGLRYELEVRTRMAPT